MTEIENIQNTTANEFKTSKKGAKALFTLAYIVSYELKKLLQIPNVNLLLDPNHLDQFKHYFAKSIVQLIKEEINFGTSTSSSICNTEFKKKKIKYSTCFIELAETLGIKFEKDGEVSFFQS